MTLGRAPDSADPVVAWRGWRVDAWQLTPDPSGWAHLVGHRLEPIAEFGGRWVWRPGFAAAASCPRSRSREANHKAPLEGCSCGLWGFKDLARLLATPARRSLEVIGEVNMWGKVIVTERGFRGQYAYPRRLIVLGRDGDRVAEIAGELSIYGVPVEIRSNREVLEMAGLW